MINVCSLSIVRGNNRKKAVIEFTLIISHMVKYVK